MLADHLPHWPLGSDASTGQHFYPSLCSFHSLVGCAHSNWWYVSERSEQSLFLHRFVQNRTQVFFLFNANLDFMRFLRIPVIFYRNNLEFYSHNLLLFSNFLCTKPVRSDFVLTFLILVFHEYRSIFIGTICALFLTQPL